MSCEGSGWTGTYRAGEGGCPSLQTSPGGRRPGHEWRPVNGTEWLECREKTGKKTVSDQESCESQVRTLNFILQVIGSQRRLLRGTGT